MKIQGASSSNAVQQIQTNLTDTKPIQQTSERGKELNNPQVSVGHGKEVNEEELIQAIEHANKSVKVYDRKLEFSIHERTKQIMVKVIDTSGDEDEVIREIPPEKVLDMVARLWEMAGILVDERA